jgi:hypothetical protein
LEDEKMEMKSVKEVWFRRLENLSSGCDMGMTGVRATIDCWFKIPLLPEFLRLAIMCEKGVYIKHPKDAVDIVLGEGTWEKLEITEEDLERFKDPDDVIDNVLNRLLNDPLARGWVENSIVALITNDADKGVGCLIDGAFENTGEEIVELMNSAIEKQVMFALVVHFLQEWKKGEERRGS